MTRMTPEERAYYEQTRRPLIRVPQSRIGKFGCGLLTTLWFMILLLPCGLFYLAFVGQITVQQSNVPEPAAHPMFELQLVMDADNRGFRVTRSVVQAGTETEVCLETYVSYYLWQSNEAQSPNTTFCDCYSRAAASDDWEFIDQQAGTCEL